jgi:hypothetical protein
MATKGKHLRTVDEVLDVVGIDRAMKIAGVKASTAPIMWCSRGNFPPRSYLAFNAELTSRGFTAAPSLWGMREARIAS